MLRSPQMQRSSRRRASGAAAAAPPSSSSSKRQFSCSSATIFVLIAISVASGLISPPYKKVYIPTEDFESATEPAHVSTIQVQPDRPRAVFHVGPHKTGSTSIQRFLWDYREKLMQEDGYIIAAIKSGRPGIKNMASLAVCLNRDLDEVAREEKLNGWCTDAARAESDFVKVLEDLTVHNNKQKKDMKHLVASSEELDRHQLDIEWLQRRLEPTFEIRIVVYYRRFYDWLGSYFNEIAKKMLMQNKTVPPMGDWLEENLSAKAEQHSLRVYQRYADVFGVEAVTVLDFHNVDEEPFEESFACRGLPEAPALCSLARSQRKKVDKESKNERESLDWLQIWGDVMNRTVHHLNMHQRMAIEQKWRGLQRKYSQPTLWRAGDPKPNDKTPIRRLCPSRQMTKEILAMSREFDDRLAGVLRTSRVKTELSMEEDFWEQYNQTFCTLDTKRIIRHWQRMPWFAEATRYNPDYIFKIG